MKSGRWRGFGSALAWFFFPLIPALLGTTYDRLLNWTFARPEGLDPRSWDLATWLIMTGPLIGFGFLAGVTLDLPDQPGRRGLRPWFSKRSIWVGLGPWAGFLAWSAIYWGIVIVTWAYPPSQRWSPPTIPDTWWKPWLGWFFLVAILYGPLTYGWLPIGWLAILRARRTGRLGPSLIRGLGVAFGFVGSLFGTFWAITEVWRGYFFDPRIAPALIAASSLALMSGCAGPETLGEVRRRDLYQAMLLAWLLGLGLAWRWWSRSRSKPGPHP